ncbi:sugar ABC transporter substrate-binding protein [Thermoanaerobacteraceae bacterium SP2]|jgi:ribose transport system substrate-binding protein|nr:sugar ABC transporter substrate-binding protein [Thermoanaerobacteraceae bacterium SP2]
MKLKVLCLVVVALLTFSLITGCGANNNTGESSSAQSESTTQTQNQEANSNESGNANSGSEVALSSSWSGLPAEVNREDFGLNPEEVKAKGFTIGFSQCVMDHPYRIDMIKKAKEAAQKYGVNLIVMDGQGKPSIEVSNIESLIARKVDAIIISSHGGVAITPAIQQAKEANIPVILIDGGKPFQNWEFVTWMSTDDWALGRGAAEMLVKEIGEQGKIMMIEGTSGSSCQVGRRGGFLEVIERYPNIKIVAQQDGNWLRKNALDIVSNVLQANPDLKAVYSHNDEMALGAIEAIEKAGKVPGKDILVYSAGDYQANAFEAIKAGKLQLTQIYHNDGDYAVEAALAHLMGKKVPKMINLGTEQATKDNVDTRTPAY